MRNEKVRTPRHCYTWLGNSTDLDTEMPTLSFQVAGTARGQETPLVVQVSKKKEMPRLTLDANSYTFLTTVPVYHKAGNRARDNSKAVQPGS